MDAATREAVCGAAVRAAQAVNYENAGTIEFIADASEGLRADRIWFMEMNTRLQVEHPVTEEITGQDLVEWQLRVASGEPLPKKQNELTITGHAIEARLYAEDPAKGFLPSVGRLDHFDLPDPGPENAALYRSPRIDTGVEEGDPISPYYDPMIAKIVTWGEDRNCAIETMVNTLEETEVWPIRTNAGFLFNALLFPGFGAGQIDTGLIERNLDELVPQAEPDDATWRGAASVATAISEDEEPLADLAGFRMNATPRHAVALGRNGEFRTIDLTDDQPIAAVSGLRDDERVVVFYEGQAFAFELGARGTVGGHGVHDGEIGAPMPGRVTAVEVSRDEKVVKGQRLLTLEAMKMEHALTAPFDGTVAELNAKPGLQVSEGQLLAKVEPAEPSS
jgi:3-methylcrotonyl-CoA carboxylase alpha subunit